MKKALRNNFETEKDGNTASEGDEMVFSDNVIPDNQLYFLEFIQFFVSS